MKTNKLVRQIQYQILSPKILNFNKTKQSICCPLEIKKPINLEIFCMTFCDIFYSKDWAFFFVDMCKNVQSLPPRVVTFYVLVFTFQSGQITDYGHPVKA